MDSDLIRVAFAVNNAYMENLGVAIYSLAKNGPESKFEIYVLGDELSKDRVSEMRKTLGGFSNITLKLVEMGEWREKIDTLALNIEYITRETYFRYLLPEVLPKVDKVIYLDVDLVVRGDLKKLWGVDLTGKALAGIEDGWIASWMDGEGERYLESIGLSGEGYVNAGVLVMNLKKMRDENKGEELFRMTREMHGQIKFQDQDVLNIVFRDEIELLGKEYNYTRHHRSEDDGEGLGDAVIVHYTGTDKPWEDKEFGVEQKGAVETYRDYLDEYREVAYGTKCKFALYKFSTENVGDEIQAIAARRFLPFINYYIDRDRIGGWRAGSDGEDVKLIANGWYMHHPVIWPPKYNNLDALLISMYVDTDMAAGEVFVQEESIMYLNRNGPVGARSLGAKEYFEKNGVDTYFSGCVTLTLQRDQRIRKQDFILLTDTNKQVLEAVKARTKRHVVYLTNTADHTLSNEAKMRQAELYLYLYQAAHCVVTSRLHTSLPCLALETPVLLLNTQDTIDKKRDRFSGLEELVRLHTEEEFVRDGRVFDVNKPPKNKKDYLKLREDLIRRCEEFTGFNNEKSFAWTDVPKMSAEDVLTEMQFTRMQVLNSVGVKAFVSAVENSGLRERVKELEEDLRRVEEEVARVKSIKGASRQLVKNVRRKVKDTLK
ncbi:hypothetical protein FWD07_02100 [Candidatus Saccharibacteria bacterium]|nr:hypothetical protein [Candidatus Saccharibacteria bacterium]